MKLAVDIGNSYVKWAILRGTDILSIDEFEPASLPVKIRHLDPTAGTTGIIATVKALHPNIVAALKEKGHFIFLDSKTPIPIANKYQTPETLGADRIAAAVGGNMEFRGVDLLIVDCGTCLKFDFVNRQNEFLGGGISPGLKMRFAALNNYTDKLPLIHIRPDQKEFMLIGDNTENSITSGVVNGIVAEIDGIINRYKETHPHLRVILTGGDAPFLNGRIKNPVFLRQNLVIRGLAEILNFHETLHA
ncbi:MAG: type III pantothenate kinase [Flavobacteriales bacterium]|nr:type III pantothenate kinase [Flavobacteriales bacterium]MCX7649241.1 type III pantothenate kinase [Flavobacteriales bacterium]MDW8431968.1 type III pantothenate kinase [Flavobacteriales bacterium]